MPLQRMLYEDQVKMDGSPARTSTMGDAHHDPELLSQVINAMEQGVIVWSADGVCEFHNTRVYDTLELGVDDLEIGTLRTDFLNAAVDRGEFSQDAMELREAQFGTRRSFAFDRKMPSGRIVSTNARPRRGGGYVVTFTDVTDSRKAALELEKARESAEQAHAKIENILDQERARQAEMEMLANLDDWLQSCNSTEELFSIVATFMERLFPGSSGELYVYSNSRDVLDGACDWNGSNAMDHIAPDSCWALRRGRTYTYSEGDLCFICDHVKERADGTFPEKYFCIPIVAHGDTVGLLHIRLPDEGDISKQQVRFASRCGEHVSMATANARLRDELRSNAVRDPLTGLYNRRHFLEALRRQIATARRASATLGIIAFDADRFKNFNDVHGHDAGDAVLQAIGDTLRRVFKDTQTPCRFGGEEFVVLVPDADEATVQSLAETLRSEIESTEVPYLNGLLPTVTVSLGVAMYPEHGSTPKTLMKQADNALYSAKEKGRNCICIAKATGSEQLS